jgi:cell division protein YceG involved in septum cleavage
MDGLYSSNPNKYFVSILIVIILLEFIIIASQSIGSFMQGYLNPAETSLTLEEEIDYTSQIEELEQKNMILEAQVIKLSNKIKSLTVNSGPTPAPK